MSMYDSSLRSSHHEIDGAVDYLGRVHIGHDWHVLLDSTLYGRVGGACAPQTPPQAVRNQSGWSVASLYACYAATQTLLLVFLTFWQATFLSVLAMFGFVKDVRSTLTIEVVIDLTSRVQTPYMTAGNINIGIGALLETFEMAYVFPHLHICVDIHALFFAASSLACTSKLSRTSPIAPEISLLLDGARSYMR